jgi:hypothetical protein
VLGKPLATFLTAPDVAAAVVRLEREPCTARRVRHLLSGVVISDRAPRRGRRTRGFSAVDVALMRLAVRLEAQGVSAWVVRVVLAYCGDEIRAAWRRRTAVALVVRGVTGTIEGVTPEADAPAAMARVPLRSVLRGIGPAMRRTRRARPSDVHGFNTNEGMHGW